ncbi:MAG: hypothetical protein AVDCRST_MAG57-2574 [uncultured Blastococcus sp.]|uniref:Uncharacterized protein n=1 Tax=uncultured Blastococcus sp. TaxID=217144 RepID=A0A6J4ITR0_9ACTN|nr:MAG: hypothetical protein AVDCRST_MAG57-2574 [uncultured Blastococcus sp.]
MTRITSERAGQLPGPLAGVRFLVARSGIAARWPTNIT